MERLLPYTILAIDGRGISMGGIFSLLLLAFAVSLDSFSVGFTYGLRKVAIPLKSIATIAACSGAVLIGAMALGSMMENTLPQSWAEHLGGIILILLGAWVLFQFFRQDKITEEDDEEKMLVHVEIKSLGIVIHILKKPLAADFDKSGSINGVEAVMLGLALSLDAFGAGLGAAMLGFSPVLLASTAVVMSSAFVFAGMKAGTLLSGISWVEKLSFLPGLLLIIVGCMKI